MTTEEKKRTAIETLNRLGASGMAEFDSSELWKTGTVKAIYYDSPKPKDDAE
jgi:hypothetical protein